MIDHLQRKLTHLEKDHAELNKRIDGMESTGVFEDVTLEVLKKQRLHLKRQIVTLKQDHNSSTHYNTEQND